jgi:hypothetical protein
MLKAYSDLLYARFVHLLTSRGLEFASSQASEARMLPVANAIDESEAP